MQVTYTIIGSSAAGLAAATTVARIDPHAQIVCISDEQENPYNKCFLVDYVSGERPYEQLSTMRAELAQHPNFKLMLGRRVIAINPEKKTVELHDRVILPYDKLCMSMGGSPVKLTLPGSDAYAGVFTFYTLADIKKLVAYCAAYKARRAVVVGAGLSGLECAHALVQRGFQVTLCERGDRVLPHQTDQQGSQLIQRAAECAGVTIVTHSAVQELVGASGRVTGVVLTDDLFVPADIVIFTIGMRPNSELARSSGIELQGRHVKVDNRLRTSIESIVACGDLVVAPCSSTGQLVPSNTWPDAVLQGTVAAYTMMGHERVYPGVIGHTVSSFFGIEISACGTLQGKLHERLVIERPGNYRLFELENGVLKAFSLLGSLGSAGMICRRVLLTKQPITRKELQAL